MRAVRSLHRKIGLTPTLVPWPGLQRSGPFRCKASIALPFPLWEILSNQGYTLWFHLKCVQQLFMGNVSERFRASPKPHARIPILPCCQEVGAYQERSTGRTESHRNPRSEYSIIQGVLELNNMEHDALTELFGAIFDKKGNLLEETFSGPERKNFQFFRKEAVHSALFALILIADLLERDCRDLSHTDVDGLIYLLFQYMERDNPLGQTLNTEELQELRDISIDLWRGLQRD